MESNVTFMKKKPEIMNCNFYFLLNTNQLSIITVMFLVYVVHLVVFRSIRPNFVEIFIVFALLGSVNEIFIFAELISI